MRIKYQVLAGVGLSFALAACSQAGSGGEASKPVCDRDCLIKLTDDYVADLAKHSPDGLPLASTVAFVENAKPLTVGEGLWKSTTGPATKFQVHVPDPVRETAGWLGMMQVDGKPTMVAIRLKLDKDGKIAEAEHLWSEVKGPALKNVDTPRPGLVSEVPAADRKSEADLIAIGKTYYDALDDNDGSKMPFAADCERHENGMITASSKPMPPPPSGPTPHPIAHDCKGQLDSKVMSYITTIGNRRVFAADPVTGLVMGLSHFHHPMNFPPYEVTAADGTKVMYSTDKQMKFKPFDLPAAHIFKVGADGKVHEIEAMGFMAPLDSPSGWENEPAPANTNAPATPAHTDASKGA
ncbi:MAG TPA: hypothetical protein VF418_03325 [Sphingomonadaceae bacterium]